MEEQFQSIVQQLVNQGVLTAEQLDAARKLAGKTGVLLGQALLKLGYLTPEQLVRIQRDLLQNVPEVDLEKISVERRALARIPKKFAKAHKVLAYQLSENTLALAVSDPGNSFAIDLIQQKTALKVTLAVASEEAILKAIEKHYPAEGAAAPLAAAERPAVAAQSPAPGAPAPAVAPALAPPAGPPKPSAAPPRTGSSTVRRKRLIGEKLIELGHITESQLQIGLQEQKQTGDLLGKTLVKLGFIMEDVLMKILAEEAGIPYVDVTGLTVPSDVLKKVSPDVARLHKVLPVSFEDGVLKIATADPYDVSIVDQVERKTKCRVSVVVATESGIANAIESMYAGAEARDVKLEQIVKLATGAAEAMTVEELTYKDAPIVALVDEMVAKAVNDRATDIHLEPEESVVRVRYRIDGVLYTVMTIPKEIHGAIAARIKIIANMDISEKRLPQDGHIKTKVGGKEIDLRVSTLPMVHGENVVVRVLIKDVLRLGLEFLGIPQSLYDPYLKAFSAAHGLVVITGPTGAGKTTTLYTALKLVDSLSLNVSTLEDPVEYELPMIRQCQVHPKIGLTFAAGLRSILRQDPDVIMVGEMRDTETAEIAVRAAMTGHLVLTTLHANSSVEAFHRLIDMGVEPFLVNASVIAAGAQRLVRRICPSCKEPYEAPADERRWLKIPSGQPVFHGKGCNNCRRTGYKGRVGIYELIIPDFEIKELVSRRASPTEFEKCLARKRVPMMIDDGRQKVLVGETTIQEIARAVRMADVGEEEAPPGSETPSATAAVVVASSGIPQTPAPAASEPVKAPELARRKAAAKPRAVETAAQAVEEEEAVAVAPESSAAEVAPAASAERGKWSTEEKAQAVLRLLRGEHVEIVSRDLGASVPEIVRWREDFLWGARGAMEGFTGDPMERKLRRAYEKLGDLLLRLEP